MTATTAAKARVRKVAKRLASPVLGRVRAEAAGSVRPQLDASREEVARLRAELATTKAELKAEIELIWAELESHRTS